MDCYLAISILFALQDAALQSTQLNADESNLQIETKKTLWKEFMSHIFFKHFTPYRDVSRSYKIKNYKIIDQLRAKFPKVNFTLY